MHPALDPPADGSLPDPSRGFRRRGQCGPGRTALSGQLLQLSWSGPGPRWDAGARHSGSQQGAGHHPASEGRKALSTRIQAQARNRRHAPQAHLVPQVEDLLAYTTTSEESFLGFHHAATARKPRSRTALKGTKGAAAPSWGGNRHVMGKGSSTSRHSALPAKRKLPIYQKATARN